VVWCFLSPANGKDAHVSICAGYVVGILVVFLIYGNEMPQKKKSEKEI
jgi:hypothetical protein